MAHSTPTLSLQTARRLAVTKQQLTCAVTRNDADGILDVLRGIRCLQLDPISAVARSHRLVLWSRVGQYDEAFLDKLLWQDRALFEYWAHEASIVLTEDYPFHVAMMRQYREGNMEWSARVQQWMSKNQELHDFILAELKKNGPMLSRQFDAEGIHPEGWVSTGWTSGRNVSRMLDFLWIRGVISVAGRSGGQKVWDLTERVFPQFVSAELPAREEMAELAVEQALKSLGVATRQNIDIHFIRRRYHELPQTVQRLEDAGRIVRVNIDDAGTSLKGTWYVHADDLALADRLAKGEWQPRTTMLSPFDNLICDRARTRTLFNFDFTIEIYVPAHKRKYGYYVLPILHGDQLIGRVDSKFNKKEGRYEVYNVYAEADAPKDAAVGKAIRANIENLAGFIGAKEIQFGENVPKSWRKALQ